MLCVGTHMESVKVGSTAASFSAAPMGTEWSQPGITRPVAYQLNKLDTTGASIQEGTRD